MAVVVAVDHTIMLVVVQMLEEAVVEEMVVEEALQEVKDLQI
jgi:hypothetical protein